MQPVLSGYSFSFSFIRHDKRPKLPETQSIVGDEKKAATQYQLFPASPSLFPFGFIETILCPGI